MDNEKLQSIIVNITENDRDLLVNFFQYLRLLLAEHKRELMLLDLAHAPALPLRLIDLIPELIEAACSE